MPYLLNNVVSYYPWVKKTAWMVLSDLREQETFLSRVVFVLCSCKNNPKSQAQAHTVIQGKQKQNKQVISTIPLFSVIGHWLWK